MAMPWLGLIIILTPLLQLSVLAYLQWGQLFEGIIKVCPKVRVNAQDLTCCNAFREQVPQDLEVHRRFHRQVPAIPVR